MSSTRSCILVVGGVLVLFMGLYVAFVSITSRAITNQTVASRELLQGQELKCPAGSTEASEPWSKGGWMRYCQTDGIDHGPWLTARAGKLAVRGEYTNGEQTGVWEWYNDDGSVFRQEIHPTGRD